MWGCASMRGCWAASELVMDGPPCDMRAFASVPIPPLSPLPAVSARKLAATSLLFSVSGTASWAGSQPTCAPGERAPPFFSPSRLGRAGPELVLAPPCRSSPARWEAAKRLHEAKRGWMEVQSRDVTPLLQAALAEVNAVCVRSAQTLCSVQIARARLFHSNAMPPPSWPGVPVQG